MRDVGEDAGLSVRSGKRGGGDGAGDGVADYCHVQGGDGGGGGLGLEAVRWGLQLGRGEDKGIEDQEARFIKSVKRQEGKDIRALDDNSRGARREGLCRPARSLAPLLASWNGRRAASRKLVTNRPL